MMHRSWLANCGVVFVALNTLLLSVASGQVSTFDADAEGWLLAGPTPESHFGNQNGNSSPATWTDTFGLPPGALFAPDTYYWTWVTAPAAFLGNRCDLQGGALDYDIFITTSDNAAYPAVALEGRDMTLLYILSPPPLSTWTHITIPLTPDGWVFSDWYWDGPPATSRDLAEVLADLRGLYILTEWQTGPDATYVDNVTLTGPTPPHADCDGDMTSDACEVSALALSESFERSLPDLTAAGWANIARSSPSNSTWAKGGLTSPFLDYHGPDDSYLYARNYTSTSSGTISTWLLTPQIPLSPNGTVTFYTRHGAFRAGPDHADRLEVRASLAGASTNVGSTATSVGDFDTLLLSVNPNLEQDGFSRAWSRYDVSLSALGAPGNGRIAFRHFVTGAGTSGVNGDYVGLDQVAIWAHADCNRNVVPDVCEVVSSPEADCQPNGLLDQCEPQPLAFQHESFDDVSGLTGRGWQMLNRSSPTFGNDSGWFRAHGVYWFYVYPGYFPAFEGPTYAYIASNVRSTYSDGQQWGTLSNWLITPEVRLDPATQLNFYTRTLSGSTYPDRLEVRVSFQGDSTNVGVSATDVGDFGYLLLSINPTLAQGGFPQTWTQYDVDLSALGQTGTGRFALRHFVTDAAGNATWVPEGPNGYYVGLDSVTITHANDCRNDGVPDECQADCNGNQVPDHCDIAEGASADANANGVPDECDMAPEPIPAVSEWGMLAMLLLLLCAASLILRTRGAGRSLFASIL